MEELAKRSARAAEADGDATVTFGFRGNDVTIPRALEAWPLDEIRAQRYGRALRKLVGEHAIVSMRLRTRGDLIELSHRCADACGATPLPDDPVVPGGFFGAVPLLLSLVDNHGDDLEADLLERYGVDYRRPPPEGPTLRQVWVYVRRIQSDSALMAARNKGEAPWTRAEILAAKQIEMWTRKRYRGRPATREEYDEWLEKQHAAAQSLDKLAEREEYYRSGQNMRDAGVDPGPRPPKQPPRQRTNPAQQALAVAMKNARRTPKGETDGRPGPAGAAAAGAAGRPKRYEPGDSGW